MSEGPVWRAAVIGQFAGASILQRGFPSNSELHIRRLFKKYDKNLHKSDLGVGMLYTFYSIMPTGKETTEVLR